MKFQRERPATVNARRLLTVDERLIEFDGRVGFREYLAGKRGKFGFKMVWLAETETAIPLQCLLYVGSGTLVESEKADAQEKG